jgi:hypothetical protein
MEWIEELASDPSLKDEWMWHAVRQEIRINGGPPEEFVTHPMSAHNAWEVEVRMACCQIGKLRLIYSQGSLDPGMRQVQVPLIFYSDKSNAARFSQVAIWPVCMRPANLPKELIDRNSTYGGNSLIALLPKVCDCWYRS